MKMMKLLASAFLATALLAEPASSAIKVITYKGTVATGTLRGFFGINQQISVAGYSYVATYVLDTARGIRAPFFGGDRVEGGADLGVATPIISATFTLSGAAFANGVFSSSASDYGAHFTRADLGVQTDAEDSNSFLQFNALVPSPATIEGNMPLTNDNDLVGFFGFFAPGSTPFTVNLMTGTFGGPGTVQISDFVTPGGVPEPTNWAMMIAGFGLVGAMARRRRTAGLAA